MYAQYLRTVHVCALFVSGALKATAGSHESFTCKSAKPMRPTRASLIPMALAWVATLFCMFLQQARC